jgi:hypothetical protein
MAENRLFQPQNTAPQWAGWHSFCLPVLIVRMVLAGVLFPARARVWAWIVILTLLAAFSAVAGRGITGLRYGLLIDERNKISDTRKPWATMARMHHGTAVAHDQTPSPKSRPALHVEER